VSSRIKRTSCRFKCRANHKSFVFPTDTIYNFENYSSHKPKRKQSTLASEKRYKTDGNSSSDNDIGSMIVEDKIDSSDNKSDSESVNTSKNYISHTSKQKPSILDSENRYKTDGNISSDNNNGSMIVEDKADRSDISDSKFVNTSINLQLHNIREDLLKKFQLASSSNNVSRADLEMKCEELNQEVTISKSTYNALQNEYYELQTNYGLVSNELNETTSKLKIVSAELERIILGYEKECKKTMRLDENFLRLKINIKNAQKMLICEKRKTRILRNKFDNKIPQMSDATTLVELVEHFKSELKEMSTKKNRSVNSLSKIVVQELWTSDFFNGSIKQKMIEKVKEYYRNNIFSPEKILKAMDMAGGQLSLQGINVLRNIESYGIKFYHSSILPSSGKIKRTCEIVDNFANQIVPFKEGILETGGEYAKFDPVHVMNLMIKAYNLTEVAKFRSIKINQAIDAALITTNMHHTTYGLKMIDKAAYDPVSKRLIYGSADSSTLQSRNNCFPLMIVLKRETKELLKEFTPIMKEVHNQSVVGPMNSLGPFHPIKTAFDSDMSATWKLCGKGGAMKRELHPCHCCAIHDTCIALPNPDNCNRWCNELHANDPQWKCYHHELLDESNVEKLKTTLQTLTTEISHIIPDINKRDSISQMNSKEDPRAKVDKNQVDDPMSIHFDYKNPLIEKNAVFEYSNRISDELSIRELRPNGSLDSRVKLLRDCLIQEWLFRSVTTSIHHAEKQSDKSFLSLIDCVPCILHLENRTGLKFFSMLLREGLENTLNKSLYSDLPSQQKRINMYLLDIANICNTKIWGNIDRPTSWQVPYDNKEKQIEDITLDNNKTRVLCNNMQLIINLCVFDNTRRHDWIDVLNNYNISIQILRRKEDFHLEDVKEFQYHTDLFFVKYMELVGRNGITNYFHLLGSGHIADYLFYYKNLYEHSQQGWEAFNSFLKVFYFRRTNRGGGRGDCSRVRQIARWLARRLIWFSGIDYSDMKRKGCINVAGDEPDTTLIHEGIGPMDF
jgi:hypothetical protein